MISPMTSCGAAPKDASSFTPLTPVLPYAAIDLGASRIAASDVRVDSLATALHASNAA